MIRDPKPCLSNIVAIHPPEIISANASRCITHLNEFGAVASPEPVVSLYAFPMLAFAAKPSGKLAEPVYAWGSVGCIAGVADLRCDVLRGDPVRDRDVCKEFWGRVVDDCECCEVFGSGHGLKFGLVFNGEGKSGQCKGQEGKKEEGDL